MDSTFKLRLHSKLYYSLLVNSNKSFKQSVPLFSHLWKRESSTIYFIGLFWENSIKWFNLKDLTQYLPQLLFNNNSVGTLNYYSSFFLFHSWSVCKTGHWYTKLRYTVPTFFHLYTWELIFYEVKILKKFLNLL